MKIARQLMTLVVLAAATLLGSPTSASADYCASYPAPSVPPQQDAPVLEIMSGYWPVGSVGSTNSLGCANGTMVADTRLIAPASKSAWLALRRTTCKRLDTIYTGAIHGLGVHAENVKMTCHSYGDGMGFFSEGEFAITGSGSIHGSATYSGVTYSSEARTLT